MSEIKLKIHACAECGLTADINVGQTSVGCHACNRFVVCTDTECAVAVWNLQNPILETETNYGLTISEEDKRNYYRSEGAIPLNPPSPRGTVGNENDNAKLTASN